MRDCAPPADRHDAFTPELMVRFCEVLAETGNVTSACRAAAKHPDTAYAHRRRNRLFAAAWAASLSHARNRLADALLERAIEGSVDYIYRDGELVGERRYFDNRLAYAMLRRMDRMAEAEPAPVAAELEQPAAKLPPKPDWSLALKALRTGSEEDLYAALALFDDEPPKPLKSPDSDDSDNPPESSFDPAGFETDRVWDEEEGTWWTNFPPPAGFDGEQRGRWEEEDYRRECTPDECRLLNAARDHALSGYRRSEEQERDGYFADLRAQLAEARNARTDDAASASGRTASSNPP